MATSSFIVVFSTRNEKPEKVLPTEPELREAMKEYLNIPDDEVGLNMWPVTIESQGYNEGECRKCGTDVGKDRLFCDDCADAIAGLQTD